MELIVSWYAAVELVRRKGVGSWYQRTRPPIYSENSSAKWGFLGTLFAVCSIRKVTVEIRFKTGGRVSFIAVTITTSSARNIPKCGLENLVQHVQFKKCRYKYARLRLRQPIKD